MEKKQEPNNCPICYNEFLEMTFLCEFEICYHHICMECFNSLKKYSDKCPICGILYKNVIKKNINDVNMIEIIELNEIDLKLINKNRAELLENYDCFSSSEIKIELMEYLEIVKSLEHKLFNIRKSNGSNKEYGLIMKVIERINLSNELLNFPSFDSKEIVENLDFIVHSIKNIKERKYVILSLKIQKGEDNDNDNLEYIGDEPINNYNSYLSVQLYTKKDPLGKKKKKKNK